MENLNKIFKNILKDKIKNMELTPSEKQLFDYSRFATDIDGETIDISDDVFVKRILEKGELVFLKENADGCVLDMPYGRCHDNCLEYMESGDYLGEKIYTGFALNDSHEWFIHTYLMDKDLIIDPTDKLFIAYFGYQLSEEEVEELKNCKQY